MGIIMFFLTLLIDMALLCVAIKITKLVGMESQLAILWIFSVFSIFENAVLSTWKKLDFKKILIPYIATAILVTVLWLGWTGLKSISALQPVIRTLMANGEIVPFAIIYILISNTATNATLDKMSRQKKPWRGVY